MTTTIASTVTLAEASALIEANPSLLPRVHAVLEVRAARKDSKSAVRAQAWLDAHPITGRKVPAKVTPVAKKSGPGSRGGDPNKYARARYAAAFGAPNTPAWWTAYRSDAAKALPKVTTHAQADKAVAKVLASK